jgi:hypothetical protein
MTFASSSRDRSFSTRLISLCTLESRDVTAWALAGVVPEVGRRGLLLELSLLLAHAVKVENDLDVAQGRVEA